MARHSRSHKNEMWNRGTHDATLTLQRSEDRTTHLIVGFWACTSLGFAQCSQRVRLLSLIPSLVVEFGGRPAPLLLVNDEKSC